MFFMRLRHLIYEHAYVYRAVTIDEYLAGIVKVEFVEKEFEEICEHWNRATQKVDLRSMAYTVELYRVIEMARSVSNMQSSWEFPRELKAFRIPVPIFSN